MIAIDANYFLRYLVQPSTARDQEMTEQAATLFGAIRAGTEVATTSDVVVAEVVFSLSNKHHYAVERVQVVARLKPLIQLPGLRLPRKRTCLRALDLWAQRPRISFVDALCAASAVDLQARLATFDFALNRVPEIKVWEPAREKDSLQVGTGPDS